MNAAYIAGRGTLKHFDAGIAVDLKSDQSPVTVADREAEALLRSMIRASYPTHGILGEEEGTEGSQNERWVIDPIDGTKSFITGVPLYATLLSFELDGEPQFGVAYFPALDTMVCAAKGEGTYINGRRCRVRQNDDIGAAIICTGSFDSLRKRGLHEGVAKLSEQAMFSRTWGDAYGHCLVATGRADMMLDPVVARYDVSSIKVIVEEAGGSFTSFSGETGIFSEAVSTTPALRDQVLAAFRP